MQAQGMHREFEHKLEQQALRYELKLEQQVQALRYELKLEQQQQVQALRLDMCLGMQQLRTDMQSVSVISSKSSSKKGDLPALASSSSISYPT
jgi:hypothetical protein